MIAPLAKFIDRSVLQIGYAMLPQSMWREAANERDLKLEQAVQFLNGPDFMEGSVCNFTIFFHSVFYGLVASNIPIGPLSIPLQFFKTKCPIVTH
jgi:hypothetical protein